MEPQIGLLAQQGVCFSLCPSSLLVLSLSQRKSFKKNISHFSLIINNKNIRTFYSLLSIAP